MITFVVARMHCVVAFYMFVACLCATCDLFTVQMLYRGLDVSAHKQEVTEPDSNFQWITPDESSCFHFSRDRLTVLQMSRQWDLCISGDGLTHLQQIGHETAFIPLAQVCTFLTPACSAMLEKLVGKY